MVIISALKKLTFHNLRDIILPVMAHLEMKMVQTPLRITLDKEGVVYVGETRIGDSLNDENQGIFKKSVDLWTQKQKPPWIVDVEADEEVRYGAMVPVVARLKELGIDMNLVIQPKGK